MVPLAAWKQPCDRLPSDGQICHSSADGVQPTGSPICDAQTYGANICAAETCDVQMLEDHKCQGSADKENEPHRRQVFTPVKICPEETKSVFSESKINNHHALSVASKGAMTPLEKFATPKLSQDAVSMSSASDKDYGTTELAEIELGTDARIDDPELLTTKKHLMLKG